MRMHTSTGRQVDPLDLRPEDVCVEDIAHHLSQTCRFNGATPIFYSVAEHAVHVAGLVEYHAGPVAALVALHHDDAEAYLGDQIRPVKSRLHFGEGVIMPFEILEGDVDGVIWEALDLPRFKSLPGMADLIKRADNAILAAELRTFWGDSPEADQLDSNRMYHTERIEGWPPGDSKRMYLTMHQRLSQAVANA